MARKKRSRIWDLFFFRRRPVFGGIPMDWEQPEEAAFQQALEYDGFISQNIWKDHDPGKHPVIVQDLKDLEQHLLPTFYQFSQRAKYFQNRYYLYQWVFIWGAFLTTLFGTLTTYVYDPFNVQQANQAAVTSAVATVTPEATADATNATLQDNPFNAQQGSGNTWSQIFGYITAIIGAVTGVVTALSNRGEPQRRWAKNRRLAEELRMHYFKYVAHLAPYDKPDRIQKLRETVVDARIKEQENVA